MLKKVKLAAGALLVCLPLAANAVPVDYDIIFSVDTPVSSGPNGKGSFTYDADTGRVSGLTWRFSDGYSGALLDTVDPFFGSLVLLGGCNRPACLAFHRRDKGEVTGDFRQVYWTAYGSSRPSDYWFVIGNTSYIGELIVTRAVPPTAVPEPGALALLGLGLFGMALARRRTSRHL